LFFAFIPSSSECFALPAGWDACFCAGGHEGAPLTKDRIGCMSKTVIATSSAPAAIGPYSQAIRVGNLIFTAGQAALDPSTGQLVARGIAEQTTRTLENLKAVLEAAGSSLAKTVKATVYLKDMSDFAAMNAVYATYLAPAGVAPPARTTIEAARLPKDALVEIELVAEV
jgi:2-iminobutanoate/2-iminopropanoate deaminase